MRRRGTIEEHERLLWGESTHGTRLSHDLHLVTPASGQKRRHSPSPTWHSSGSPINPSEQPRRRPRGSEAGKSIHKAAEATQNSPAPSVTHRSSISAVTPTNHPRTGRIAAIANPDPPRHANSHTLIASVRDGAEHSLSPARRFKPQVARKSGSKPKRTARKQLATKAARKSVISPRPPSDDASSAAEDLSSESGSSDSDDRFSPRGPPLQVPDIQPGIGPDGQETKVHSPLHREKCKSPGSNIVPHPARSHPATSAIATLQAPFRSADTVPPPQPLIDAFENLFVYPLYLHRVKRLPFLLRNVRASFRAWCRDHDKRTHKSMADTASVTSSSHVSLIYEYTSPEGEMYTFETVHSGRECPVCSVFGVFSSWEDLRRHVMWDHGEIGCEFSFEDGGARLLVRLNEHVRGTQVQSIKPAIPAAGEPSPIEERALTFLKSLKLDQSIHSPSTSRTPHKVTASNRTSPHRETPHAAPDPDIASTPPCPSSSRQVLPPASPRSQPPTPPPLSNTHGAAHPITPSSPQDDDPLYHNTQPQTYRPTGPHLYDHLSKLPLGAFGRQRWFVLDKEEEIFELVDVLDEDKVVCALWGRWILLNRPFFIGNYVVGVEAFVDEYWLVIHRAAGWGALRAWLMVLVSRRFLKNVELVRVLKRYNALVGKNGG